MDQRKAILLKDEECCNEINNIIAFSDIYSDNGK